MNSHKYEFEMANSHDRVSPSFGLFLNPKLCFYKCRQHKNQPLSIGERRFMFQGREILVGFLVNGGSSTTSLLLEKRERS